MSFYIHFRLFSRLLVLILTLSAGSVCIAQATETDQQMRSLDNEVQEIKSDVLSIAAELGNLEERLLYPSNTQLAVFLAIDPAEKFRLDAVRLEIDGELTTHYIYSFQELEALRKGGVQRLYTANVTTGEHQLDVTMIGKLSNGEDFEHASSFMVGKGVSPKAVGLTLAAPGSPAGAISIGDW